MNSKTKLLPLLAGVMALSVSIGTALPAFSQETNSTPPVPGEQMRRRPNFLNLTAEQQAKMDQIRQNERSQIDAILTAEQKAQLAQRRSERGNRQKPPAGTNQKPPRMGENRGMPGGPFASLNLTDTQRSQIEAVMRSSREQMDAVLTPEQRQQLQQHMQQHQQLQQQRRQSRSQSNQSR